MIHVYIKVRMITLPNDQGVIMVFLLLFFFVFIFTDVLCIYLLFISAEFAGVDEDYDLQWTYPQRKFGEFILSSVYRFTMAMKNL